MDIKLFPSLQPYFTSRLSDVTTDREEYAQIENFLLDERPIDAVRALYRTYLDGNSISRFDDWQDKHADYLKEELEIDRKESKLLWTFRRENEFNRLRQIEPRLYLVRVERAAWPCSLVNNTSPEFVRTQIDAFGKGDGNARAFLERLLTVWNEERDQRPLFATTELEVEDILADATGDWADRLRNRLGLGHYDPAFLGPVDIFLMRYTVEEVIQALENNMGHPAIPTVLDGGFSQYFFPTPIPAPTCGETPYGHTLNLGLEDSESDYQMGIELLHPRIDYKPEHLYRVGVIQQPLAMPFERARSFHLPWLRLQYDREDFGSNLSSAAL